MEVEVVPSQPSRFVLIGSETGSPIYYDHKDGRMLIPPLITMQEVLEEMFGERAERMTTGSGEPFVFVTAKWHGFVLCMVDNSGQDAVFLRAQLFLIFRLLVLVFGPNAMKTKQSPFFLRHKKQLQRLIDLASFYCSNDQSFLVRALEQLDVNKELVRHVRGEMQKVLKTLPHASHALLFAGTKLLCSFAKPDFADLHVQDVFSLLLYSRSLFHPIEREVETDELPVADYTDHAGLDEVVASAPSATASLSTTTDETSNASFDDAVLDAAPDEDGPHVAVPASLAQLLELVDMLDKTQA